MTGFHVGQSLSLRSTDLGTGCCFPLLTKIKGMEPAGHGLSVEVKIYLIWGEYLLWARYSARCFANITSKPGGEVVR